MPYGDFRCFVAFVGRWFASSTPKAVLSSSMLEEVSMKVLFIGGTGTISTAVVEHLAELPKWEVYVLNRGNRLETLPSGVHQLTADIRDIGSVERCLGGLFFDVVCDFIGFAPSDIEPLCGLLKGRVGQFVYISSASAYQKPPKGWLITEDTPLENPYWEYSRNKIACERYLMGLFHNEGFPVTIVRPSHTYCERSVPVAVHGAKGSWQVLKRMIEGKPVVVHGDGSSLWTVTDSRDFAKAFVGLLGNPKAIGQAFHITSDESNSWNRIYETIAACLSRELGRTIDFVPCYVPSSVIAEFGPSCGYDMCGNLLGDKANSVVFDNSKVKSVVPSFNASISMEEGFARTIHNVVSSPELQREDPEFDAWCDRLVTAMDAARRSLGVGALAQGV